MGRPMDASISSLMTQPTIRTTFIVDIAAPTPRKYTNYPSGLTVPTILGSLTITAGGTGFTAAPVVTFSGGGGQGAAAIATITGGVVTALTIISRGWGYTSNPTVAITGGGGSGATATAALSVTFPYAPIEFSTLVESQDGTSTLAGSLTFVNTSNLFTDLVTNAVNLLSPISIQRVWRDASDNVSGTEIWLEGFTGRPSFQNEYVTLTCHADLGRRGKTSKTQWSEVLVSHVALAPQTKIPWLSGGTPSSRQ